jgi:hypothetical protein
LTKGVSKRSSSPAVQAKLETSTWSSMMNVLMSLSIAISIAGSATAQTVEFRVIERHPGGTGLNSGNILIGPGYNILDYAVQARVTGAADVGFGQASFSIQMPGEFESRGTLVRGTINNADGSYFPTIATSSSAGKRVGVANAYAYLVGLDSKFNGVINGSSGSWTQSSAQQDIGLITPAARGASYLQYVDLQGATPGSDPDGVPDNGTGQVDPDVLNQYFGANGNWVDIYRFEYIVSDFMPFGPIPVNLVIDPDTTVSIFSTSAFRHDADANVDVWTPDLHSAPFTVAPSPTFRVFIPAAAPSALFGLAALAIVRRRRA